MGEVKAVKHFLRVDCIRLGVVFLALAGAVSNPALSIEAPISPYLNTLIHEARSKRLADRRQWRLLLHYRHNVLGRSQSEIDDPNFFLSPRGQSDPEAELEATLQAFFSTTESSADPPRRSGGETVSVNSDVQHPQCRYPARYAWLKEQLHFDSRLPEQPCPRFEKWRDQLKAESMTMIFASYYLNNPASMYGHTFLMLNSAQEPLLDYVVNFAAYPNTANGLLFAVRGLTGGYPGRFSTMPYYMKVQEYNNLESRDLWEYALALGPESLDRLVRHLWELGQTSIAYYFLLKNCSYQLLPLLEVADPALHLSDGFRFKAIPVDTLRVVLRQTGLVSGVRRRPSHVSKMLLARGSLAPPERRLAESLALKADSDTLKGLQTFPVERQARILDSAYDLFRYKAGFSRDQTVSVQEQDRALLLARNSLRITPHPRPLPQGARESLSNSLSPPGERVKGEGDSPDHGHPTGRVGVSLGLAKHSTFEEISLRPALHDQDDDSAGYIPGSQLEMFHLRLRYDNDRQTAYAQEFTLVNIMSLTPWDRWVHPPSWNVRTGLSVANDLDRDPENSLYYGLNGGPGYSLRTHGLGSELFYALAQVDTGIGRVFRDNYRLGAGVRSGVVWEPFKFWKIHFKADVLDYPLGEPGPVTRLELIQAVPLGRAAQFRATLARQNNYKEVLFSILRYL